jgi:hypothetical protein
MRKKFLLKLYPVLLLAWFIVFSIEIFSIAHWLNILRRTTDRLDARAQFLQKSNREVAGFNAQIGALSKEMDFLRGLVNVLPQEKGFVRTQKAMLDDVEALRAKVGRRLHGELHILVDTRANKLYVKRGLKLLWQADCSVGRGGMLVDRKTGRRWEFVTPRGQFEVLGKMQKPLWIKPDWAFVETGEKVPPPEDSSRRIEGELGGYVLNLGDGYLIHGTKNEEMLGRPVSHGCVRLGADDLKKLYEMIPVGTRVFIY